MSSIVKSIGKVFRKIVKVAKKIAPYALVAAAVIFTAGTAMAAMGFATPGILGWGPALTAKLTTLGGGGMLSSIISGAMQGAGTGAAIGGVGAIATGGNVGKGLLQGALTGAAIGGATGGIGHALGGGAAVPGKKLPVPGTSGQQFSGKIGAGFGAGTGNTTFANAAAPPGPGSGLSRIGRFLFGGGNASGADTAVRTAGGDSGILNGGFANSRLAGGLAQGVASGAAAVLGGGGGDDGAEATRIRVAGDAAAQAATTARHDTSRAGLLGSESIERLRERTRASRTPIADRESNLGPYRWNPDTRSIERQPLGPASQSAFV